MGNMEHEGECLLPSCNPEYKIHGWDYSIIVHAQHHRFYDRELSIYNVVTAKFSRLFKEVIRLFPRKNTTIFRLPICINHFFL